MLEVKHLSYTVTENQETLPIVTDISFTVNDGEMLVITGRTGAVNLPCQAPYGSYKGDGRDDTSGRTGYHPHEH